MASRARFWSFVDQADRFLPTLDLSEGGRFAGCDEFYFDFDADTAAEETRKAARDRRISMCASAGLDDHAKVVAT